MTHKCVVISCESIKKKGEAPKGLTRILGRVQSEELHALRVGA